MRKATGIMDTTRTTSSQYRGRPTRLGFTLIELMIVIAVILLLMTITIAAFANFIVTSKEAATAATIAKLNKILQQRKEAFNRLNLKSAAKALNSTNANVNATTTKFNLRAAEVIVRKQRFEIALPQRYEERSLFNGIDYKTWFQGLSARPNYESSALLYLAITDGETFGAPQVDDDAFTTAEVTSIPINVNGTTLDLKYFIDAWGQPLRFYRWPTGLIREESAGIVDRSYALLLNPTLPPRLANSTAIDPLKYDPDDPSQFFSMFYLGLPASQQTNFQSSFNLYFDAARFHTPLLVSAGPDRSLGLYEPNDPDRMNGLSVPLPNSGTSSTTPLNDNITNLNQRNKGN